MSAIVVVESPAKAKTITKFLGPGYQVVATYGHIRDLPKKNGSVDPENGFQMIYQIPKNSEKHVDALVKAARKVDEILLATDPDREGEAISWHVQEVIRSKRGLKDIPIKRVVFHEITRRAIQEAVENAREIDQDMVDAQQARRALDYLVGFNLSPLLWKKVRRGLSAGRVQSVALRLVCEREDEITSFVPREYWSIMVEAAKIPERSFKDTFFARLAVAEGKKLSKFAIPDEETATRFVKAIKNQPLHVIDLVKKQTRRNPAPPFITSTLQQEASRKLGFSAKKTMMIAQRLYEGAEGASEEGGLITYMRTDSVNLAEEALTALREEIDKRFGADYLPSKPRYYKSSAKNAQEAHEAIRPTDPHRTPEQMKGVLTRDMYRLYELIWKRTMACQMSPARIDKVAATIAVGEANEQAPFQLRANGSSIAFQGFIKVYTEGRDEVSAQDRDEEEGLLPPLEKGEELTQKGIQPKQHFTEPRPRYTEATLVKALESYGIGRPSTYAPTMSTLQDRGYVKLESRKFFPEDVGMVVNRFLVGHFEKYVDYHFTAHLEDDLDAVSRGEKTWKPLLGEFWSPFIERIEEKDKTTKRSEVTTEATDEKCPKCGQPLLIKLGRYGRFKACSGYPECNHTEDLNKKEGEESTAEPEVSPDRTCSKCGGPMLIKTGRFGKYLACAAYPDCKNIEPLEKPKDTGILCVECGKANYLEKKSRRGKIFYSCARYPDCKNALWNKPLNIPCPKCGAPFVTEKITKRRGPAQNRRQKDHHAESTRQENHDAQGPCQENGSSRQKDHHAESTRQENGDSRQGQRYGKGCFDPQTGDFDQAVNP